MKSKDKAPSRLKATILNWLGFGFSDYENWANYYEQDSATGIRVSTEKALTLSAVWSCTRLIAQTISTLPIGMYQRQPDGGRVLADDLPVARLIYGKPNADMMAVVFWESMVSQALLLGNAFAEKRRLAGRIVALDLLSTERMSWRKKVDGEYEFRYLDDLGKSRIIPEDDLFHVPGFSFNGRFGMSVIKYGNEVFGAALAGHMAANSTFKNGLLPTVYFKMDKLLTPQQREEFRANIKNITGALNAGKSPLLEGGMTTDTIGIDPADAQLLESRVFSIEEVCRWFGVPPSMIGSTDKASSWASSSESLNLWFLQYGLRPWLKRIEQAIWSSLLTPVEQLRYYAEFSVEGLLRADTEARTSFYSSALQNGWMSRNEVRKLENLPAVPGGEILTAQSNLLPLEKLGGDSDSAAVRAALMHWLKEPEGNT